MSVYDSLLDVPLDEQDAADDGDDSTVPSAGPHEAPRKTWTNTFVKGVTQREAIAVRFFPLKLGSRGKPVRALNRALSKAGFRKWTVFSFVFTIWVKRALQRFQKSRGLPQTGVYDRATHEKLARYYDAYAIKYLLLTLIPKPTNDELERAEFLSELMYLYNNRYAYPYTQARPFDCRKPPSRGLDCSASGEWAGEHSPIGSLSGFPGCGYGNCHSPDTRILTADLRWVPAGDLEVGDELWAFDESRDENRSGRGRTRRFRQAVVTNSVLARKECVRVVLSTGEEIVCTTDHPWLALRDGQNWLLASHLLGAKLVRPFLPWEAETSYEAGWLAGMYDGEGWVQKCKSRGGSSGVVGITQAVGATADRLVETAQRYGSFHVATVDRRAENPNSSIRLDMTTNGNGVYGAAEFLGKVRPERLVSNFTLEGISLENRHDSHVVAVQPLGIQEIQSITTTEQTYVAEGFAVHNTDSQIARFRLLNRVRSSISQAKLGDPLFYGSGGDPSHEGYYLGRDKDGIHRIWSFGSFPAKILDWDYRSDFINVYNLTGRP